jgi:hypothetical protein
MHQPPQREVTPMTEISQSETLRSHITHLLEEQKYDEALPILWDLSEKNPSDRDLRMYRLLVVRILVLHWNLSRAATGAAMDSCTIAKRIITRLASVVRVPETTKLIQSLDQIYRAPEAALAKRRIKRVITAGAGAALLTLCIAEGSNVPILVPSNLLTSTYASHSTVTSSGAAAYNPNNPGPADEEDRQIPLAPEGEERNFSPAISDTSQLLPNEHLQGSTETKLPPSVTDVAKATFQVNASKFVAKREPATAVLNVESSTEVAANENNGNKTPREILGYYQSQRAIRIRKSMSFAAAVVQEIDSGISLSVLEFVGSWAKVEVGPAGMTGFVRREFLTSVKKNESNVADKSPSGEEISDATLFPLGSTS